MEQRWIEGVVARTNTLLEAFLDEQVDRARQISDHAPELVEAVRDLTLRGGKRLRPAALYAGFRSVDGTGAVERTVEASAAIELLQTYLLIQDDWMDQDPERRGGPSVHERLRSGGRSEHLAASLAILAADMAAGFAWELLGRAPFPEGRGHEGRQAFHDLHFEVLCGQQLDLLGDPDVARMHALKTGSYTVQGPLRLGALLGDASEDQLEALQRFARPVGQAFQLRDDLLGTFGDRGATGKPIGNDLRAGKHTALIAEARATLQGDELALLERVHGDRDASAADVAQVAELLTRCGAKQRVEQRLGDQLAEALAVLGGGELKREGTVLLEDLTARLGRRDH